MSCSCHINPPCSYCMDSYECGRCSKIRNIQEHGCYPFQDDNFCDSCFNEFTVSPPECECGKEKHNFSNHSTWCPKYE